MAELTKTSNEISFTTNIFTKKEDGMLVAHCLELDIVAVAATLDEVQREIVSLICAQIDYAFTNDNLENLFHPAPPEVWQEFYKCKEQIERTYPIREFFKQKKNIERILPPFLITKTCKAEENICYA